MASEDVLDMKKKFILIIFLLVITAGYLINNAKKDDNSLSLQISGDRALSIIESNHVARAFIKENFENESNRITRVALVWNQTSDKYVWKIELMERSCGCTIEGEEGLNVLKAEVDPKTGKIIDIQTRTGVKEETLARERCMEGCHASDKKVEKLEIIL